MDFGAIQGTTRSDTSGIARIFNVARQQKDRDFCYELVGHHTSSTRLWLPRFASQVTPRSALTERATRRS